MAEQDWNETCIAHYHAGRYNMFTPTDGGVGPFLEEVLEDPDVSTNVIVMFNIWRALKDVYASGCNMAHITTSMHGLNTGVPCEIRVRRVDPEEVYAAANADRFYGISPKLRESECIVCSFDFDGSHAMLLFPKTAAFYDGDTNRIYEEEAAIIDGGGGILAVHNLVEVDDFSIVPQTPRR